MSQVILHHNGAYNLFESAYDGPCWEHAVPLDVLTDWYKEMYGKQGLLELQSRLHRAHLKGTSSHIENSIAEVISIWLSKNKTRTVEKFIDRYLTLRESPKKTKDDPE
jgi:hypothetical protein